MALLFFTGFDHYATADITKKWTGSGVGSFAVSQPTQTIAAAGRTGTSCYRITYASTTTTQGAARAYLFKTLAPADATCILGFAFKTSVAVSQAHPIASVVDGTVNDFQLTLVLNADYTISLFRGSASSGTLLGTTSTAISNGNWHYIELEALIDNSGTYDVYLDGVNRLTGSGDTQNTANASWNVVRIGFSSATANNSNVVATGGGTWDYDDVYICDGDGALHNTALGDVNAQVVYPDGDGAHTDFTPSTGTDHYTLVDETTPNDDTDYNKSSTVGHRDTLTYAALPATIGSIVAVQVVLDAKKDDAGTRKAVEVTRIASTDYDGATESTLAQAYEFHSFILPQNPDTSADWLVSDVDNAEFGYKISS